MGSGVMMQYFQWYTSKEDNLWQEVAKNAASLAKLGISAVWLPPACKGDGGSMASGYDIYDLFDLGEFEQKNSTRTKFGTKEEYKNAVKTLQSHNIQVYADIVVNHKAGADETELIKVRKVNPENRNEFISDEFDIEAYTKFTFPGRNKKYSEFIWNHTCFSGVDYDHLTKETGIYSIINDFGDGWEEVVDEEKGNYDYLMYADIEFRNPAVRDEIKYWGKWYLEEVGFDGVRLDAVKHMSPKFYNEWLDYMRTLKPDLFAVGEYWAPGDLALMLKYIEATSGRMSLFDAALHNTFHNASKQGNDFDLTTILDNSLTKELAALSVTVVDNHDTQPLQSLEAPVEAWFKPIAYSIILLRQAGYPCLFYPDLYGAHYTGTGGDGNDVEIFLDPCENIEKLLEARQRFAHGDEFDYFDHPNCISWTRKGVPEVPGSGCAVIISNGDDGFKSMSMGAENAHAVFIDFLGKHRGEVTLDDAGVGDFQVPKGSVSVWVGK